MSDLSVILLGCKLLQYVMLGWTSEMIVIKVLWVLSWIWPGQGQFSPEASREHSQSGWHKLARQNEVLDTMCLHAGFQWGSWLGKTVAAWECAGHHVVRVALSVLLFVLYILLICIVVVTVHFICCSVKLPLSRPTIFLPFCFSSPPCPSGGRGGRATAWPFFADHGQTTTNFFSKLVETWHRDAIGIVHGVYKLNNSLI